MTPELALDPTWRVTTKFFKRGRSVVHAQVKPAKSHIGIRCYQTFEEEANQTSKYLLSVSRYFNLAEVRGNRENSPPSDSFTILIHQPLISPVSEKLLSGMVFNHPGTTKSGEINSPGSVAW